MLSVFAAFEYFLFLNVLLQDRDKHSGFLNEAKEWAGELLSGQTKVNIQYLAHMDY